MSSDFGRHCGLGFLEFEEAPFRSRRKLPLRFDQTRVLSIGRWTQGRTIHLFGLLPGPQLLLRTPRTSGRQAAYSSARSDFDHRMTQACLHTALLSCAYVQSSRNMRYNLMASLRATATLASARCLRTASRR